MIYKSSKENQRQPAVEENLRVTINLYKKQCLTVMT